MDQHKHDDPFVGERLGALTPVWTPATARARGRLDESLRAPRAPRVVVALIAAVMLCSTLVFTPQVRTYAQDVWARWTMTGVGVMTVPIGLLAARSISFDGGRTYATQADAERAAGFSLHIPPAAGTGQALSYITTGSIVGEEVIDTARLEAALARAGAVAVAVPSEWNGAAIRIHVRNAVVVQYPNDLVVGQTVGFPALEVPVGIPLNDLVTTMFRASGMSAEAARAAGLAYAIRPVWLFRVGRDEWHDIEHLSLRNGSAWLMADVSTGFRRGMTMTVRSNDHRVYVVLSPNREQAIAVTEALP